MPHVRKLRVRLTWNTRLAKVVVPTTSFEVNAMAEYQSHWSSKQETLSPKEYRLVQEKALSNELDYVWKNSAFYRQKFSETGLEPSDIKGLNDLHKLPFTEKSELRDSQINHPPLGSHAIVPLEKVSRVYSTSGSFQGDH